MKDTVQQCRLYLLCAITAGLFAVAIAGGGCSSSKSSLVSVRLASRIRFAHAPASGPLRVSSANSRYFADNTGHIVYLTGSHTWNNFQDWGTGDPIPAFDYQQYLQFLDSHGQNFFRLYVWEQATGVPWSSENVVFDPMPYQRTGPGNAVDGRPRFDLREWNPHYFERLRQRVRDAEEKGIYVSVMLFNGWSVDAKRSAFGERARKAGLGDPWRGHPFNITNNVNGIDGGGWGRIQTLRDPQILELQRAYVAKVIETVGDLDNVLWEISNESGKEATLWEFQMVNFIHAYEAGRPKQHPVGMTSEFPDGDNTSLWQSPADWISPGSPTDGAYATDPPAGPGGKVLVIDTDHIWGIGGSTDWVWKSFTRGLNPIFMDPLNADLIGVYPMFRDGHAETTALGEKSSEWDVLRDNLGYTRVYAERMNLSTATPHEELTSSGFCLARPGAEYLVYQPIDTVWKSRLRRLLPSRWLDSLEVDLSAADGPMKFEWFYPRTGEVLATGSVMAGTKREFAPPMAAGGLALYIYKS